MAGNAYIRPDFMKTLDSKVLYLSALLAALLTGAAANGQIPTAGSSTGINAAFVKLFAPATAFTARAETQVFDATQKETVRMPIEWAALDGKVRLELNLEQMTSKEMTPATLANLKQAGMSRIISVFRPDKQCSYVIYPGVQSYLNIPLAKGEAEALQKGLKLEKTPLGNETIDGHACVKNKVVVRGEKGAVLQAVTWNAADLKDFPVQIEMKEKQDTVRIRFSQVRLVRADSKQFELPTNYGQMK
jgi:hypothetical protein